MMVHSTYARESIKRKESARKTALSCKARAQVPSTAMKMARTKRSTPGTMKYIASLVDILRQYQIENYRKDEYHCNAVVCEDSLDDIREDVEHLAGLGESKTHAERH